MGLALIKNAKQIYKTFYKYAQIILIFNINYLISTTIMSQLNLFNEQQKARQKKEYDYLYGRFKNKKKEEPKPTTTIMINMGEVPVMDVINLKKKI